MCYGHPPRQLRTLNLQDCIVTNLGAWLKERLLLTILVQHQLTRAQIWVKAPADKGRSERKFNEGDMVCLKLQPHVHTFVAMRPHDKLSFKFYGPFKIMKKVGLVDYKLDLPTSAHIHLVVHVSQLKNMCIRMLIL